MTHAIIRHFKRPSVKVAVWFMKRSDNLIEFIKNNPDLAREMLSQLQEIDETIFQKIALYLYKVSDLETDKIDAIMEIVSVQTKDAFAEARRDLEFSAVKRIAVNMINEGATDEYICKITGLKQEQVQHLRKENSH